MFSAETRASVVKWACIVGVFAYPAAWAVLALGQGKVPALTVADLRPAMPKDQAEFIDRIDTHKELQRAVRAERNGLRRKELTEKLKESQREIEADFSRRLTAGIKGWAGVVLLDGPRGMTFAVPEYLNLSVEYKGMSEPAKEAVRGLAKGDRVVVSVKSGDPKVKATATTADGATTLAATLDGLALSAAEKAK